MSLPEPIARLCARIQPVSATVATETQALLDRKTKPRGSLGQLEELACRVAAIRGEPRPPLPEKAIVVMAADHGVADEGVSAYPAEVTAQMVLNFAHGGAAINVLAGQAGARIVVADLGVKAPLAGVGDGVRDGRIGPGTRNLTREPAMSEAEAVRALSFGAALAGELAGGGITLAGIGEMGIGNTTSASALVSAFLGAAPEEVTGRGTGVDDAGWHRKVDAIRRALALHRPDPARPLDVLARLGGFEIVGLAGFVLGAAAARLPVVVDGFIASTAALAATRLCPPAAGYLLPSHRSVEVGHRLVLAALGLKPLLDLDLRLGEGTGAALAMGLVEASLRIVHEMATFDEAGVSDSGR